MFYSETLEIRKPLVFATAEQLENPKTLKKVRNITRYVMGLSLGRPQNQYAVTCEDKLMRTKVSNLLLGTYFTGEEAARQSFPPARPTIEDGVYYSPLMGGSPTGLVDTHTTNYVEKLVENGALQLDGYALLTDADYLERAIHPVDLGVLLDSGPVEQPARQE